MSKSIFKPTEAQEQTVVFEWAVWNERRWQELKLLYHCPNGGSRNKAEAANLKRQGVKAGVPDICLPVARRGYHGLYIELKSKGGRISDSQADWLNALKQQGFYAMVCYGADEAIEHLAWYLEG